MSQTIQSTAVAIKQMDEHLRSELLKKDGAIQADKLWENTYTVIVESISRFARNTRDLLDLVEQLTNAGIEFASKKEAIDTTTPSGKFMLTVFAAVAELEREYILQRQKEGIAIAKARGIYKGRKPIQHPDFPRVIALWREGKITAIEAMRRLDMEPSTFYRKVKAID